MAKRRPLLVLMVTTIVITILIGSGQIAAQPSEQTVNVLAIGYIGEADSDMALGLQLAITEINRADGPFDYELIIAQSTSVSDALQELNSQSVVAIFGPNSNEEVLGNLPFLSNASAPVFTAATDETLLNQDTAGNIFRVVAPESVYGQALADYLVNDLALQVIVIAQLGAEWNGAVASFSAALNQVGVPPAQMIQAADVTQFQTGMQSVPGLNPDAVVMFGPPDAALNALTNLRNSGWNGIFAYRRAQIAGFQNDVVAGVLGVGSWTYGANDTLSSLFITNYVNEYGTVPGALSVAGYDTIYALNSVIVAGGPSPASTRQRIPQMRSLALVRGPVDPAAYGGRTLSRTAFVYELNGRGGAAVVAVYDNGVSRAVEERPIETPVPPSPTPRPSTSTPFATATLFPSATPSVLTATVATGTLNVRSGPGTNYDRIDQVQRGQQMVISGRNGDFTWLFVQYNGKTGWVFAEFVDIFDPGGFLAILPVIPDPPTPTAPAPTATSAPQDADLVITSVTLTPTQPQPGVPTSATVTIMNQGLTDAGPFAVATSFLPGELYTAQNLGGLGAGQVVTTTLTTTFTTTGYVPDLAIVVDLNNEVYEGADGSPGETNNIYSIAYKVDRPIVAEAQITLNSGNSFDFFGGTIDVTWDGTNLNMAAGPARVGPMPVGETYENSHYDQVPTYALNTSAANPQAGGLYALIVHEGQYGFIRIDGRSGASVTLTYRVYAP